LLLQTAGAKAYSLIKKLENQKNEASDKQSFIDSAKKNVEQYNSGWQNIEDDFIARSVTNACVFNSYLENPDTEFPNLKYRTFGVDVRSSHAANEGVVKPFGEWAVIPPYEPNCRCYLEKTADKPVGKLTKINQKWANNPAMSEVIFKPANGYFKEVNTLKGDDKTEVKRNIELLKEYMSYNIKIEYNGKNIHVNDFHDQYDGAKQDAGAQANKDIEYAKLIVDLLKKDVYIRPHLTGVAGKKSPEYGIGTPNTLGDLKAPTSVLPTFISHGVEKANEQKCKYVVMDISVYKGDVNDLKDKIKDSLFYDGSPQNINIQRMILIRDKKIIQLTRKQIKNDLLNDLDLLN